MTLASTETLIIPDVAGLSVPEAVERYRAAGLTVFPVIPDTKRPAVEWKSFKIDDPWPEGDFSIGLPMNINRLVAVDVDHPENLPPEMIKALEWAAVQTTDANPKGVIPRGHYLWKTTEEWSNSPSKFPGAGWGDVRGAGFLVVAPSPHARPDGHYAWYRRGIPTLTTRVEGWLTPAGESTHSGTGADLAEFLANHTEVHDAGQLQVDLAEYRERLDQGEARNTVLASAFGRVFRRAVLGWYSAQAALDAVEELANSRGPYEDDRFQAMAERFARTAMDDPGDAAPFKPLIISEAAGDELPPSDFWESRRTLATIRQAAKARMIGPYGLLGAVLVDVVAAVPPSIEVDTYGGDHASLNMFIALVGPSGAGKSRIGMAVRDVINLPEPRVYWQSLRSGEGLVHMFIQRRGKDIERIADSAVIDMDEIDRLTALGDRTGSTIMPTLRTAWIGGTLGGRAATQGLDLVLEHGTYRVCLVAGVQPGRSRALLGDADGGTPQRFVWLPANDPDAELDHEWPDPIEWDTQEMPAGVSGLFGAARRQWLPTRNLTLPAEVVDEWKRDALMRARGGGDPLDAHKMLATAKLAAAFALLEMKEDVDLEDWRLAKHLMNVSLVTREGLKTTLTQQTEREAKSRGRVEGIRQEAAEASAEAARYERIQANLIRKLQSEPMTRGALHRNLAGRDRDAFDAVFEDLVETGAVIADGNKYIWKGGN